MAINHGYIGRAPSDSSVTVARQVFNVSGVTTDFTFSSGYDVGYLDVFINGTKIINGDDYTATDTSTISILNGGAVNGDVVEAVAYKAFNVASVDSSSGSFTVGLNLSVDSNISAGGSITGSAFYGDGSNLTGVDSTALKDTNDDVRVQATTTGATITGDLTVDNISVGGTLTYDDVTNVDSIGIVTARSGIIVVGGGVTVTGVSTFYSAVKVGTGITIDPASGVITATKFSGDGSGLIGVASTDNIITGTAATFNNVVKVGTGITMDATTGIITATAFHGDGSNLTFAPKIIAFDPAALSTGVAVDTNITITFDQNIQFAGTGTIELRSTSTSGTLIESFAITSGTPASGLSISGTQLIINPTSNLADNTVVYVILPNQGIQATSGGSYYAGSSNYNFRTVAQSFTAQGGTEYTLVDSNSPLGSYKYHIFAGPGILTTTSPAGSSPSLQLLAIGGGGGGGSVYPAVTDPQQGGGGGGAGGYITHTESTLSLASGTYTVTVGAGGSGGNNLIPDSNPDVQRQGENGGDTTITPPASPTTYLIRAYGGGGGGGEYPGGSTSLGDRVGQVGGSGGGGACPVQASATTAQPGGLNIPGQGYAGSEGISYHALVDTGENGRSAGGGGGAGGSGPAGTVSARFWSASGSGPYPYSVGGAGGNGVANSNFVTNNLTTSGLPAVKLNAIGANGYYGAGGGGVACGSPVAVGGKGGLGGGGNGCNATNLPESAGNSAPAYISPAPYPSGSVAVTEGVANATGVGCGGGGGSVNQYAGHGTDGAIMIRYAVPPV